MVEFRIECSTYAHSPTPPVPSLTLSVSFNIDIMFNMLLPSAVGAKMLSLKAGKCPTDELSITNCAIANDKQVAEDRT